MKQTKVVSIISTKGGEGKSSITTALASTLSQKPYNLNVLVLDGDIMQRSISRHRDRENKLNGNESMKEPFIVKTIDPGEDMIVLLGNEKSKNNLRGEHDIIFIDVKGSEDNIQYTLAVCDYIFIPLVADDYDTDSTFLFMKIINRVKEAKEKRGLDLTAYSFINMFRGSAFDKQLLEFGERMYNIPMLESYVKYYESFKSMKSTYKSMLNYPKTPIYRPVMDNFKAFTSEVKLKLGL
jgi:cellulose biosynthesis protein BcsQ